MAILKLENINKIYDNGFHAVHDFNLDINDKEFIVLVGPSGCGKSTTLRMIAGLEEITLGEFTMDGKIMNKVNPKDRDIAIVFQSYALYPHMNVYENMAFGLRLRNMDDNEVDEKVNEAAEVLGLQNYLDRKPRELSGGQRQRVALGRAITRKPKVFLMDEPLSNLDAKLRVQMRTEIIKIHRAANTTTVYVTHDQIEAMTMADRIVIMKDGYIQQVGTPDDLYHRPNNIFVAGFIGDPPMNFFRGRIDKKGVFTCVKNNNFQINIGSENLEIIKDSIDKELVIGVRPEDMDVDKPNLASNEVSFSADINLVEMLGDYSNIYCELKNFNELEPTQLIARISSKQKVDSATPSVISFPQNKIHLFDGTTEKTLKR